MSEDGPAQHYPLLEGVLAWCDQDIIAKIVEIEEFFSFTDLQGRAWPQIHPDRNRQPRQLGLHAEYRHLLTKRDRYWGALEDDLKKKLTREELFLEGVLVTPEMDHRLQAINGALATEYDFNLRENTLRFKGTKFVSVTLSTAPSPWAPLELGPQRRPSHPQPLGVEGLTAEQLVALIEEHARRVVADPEAKLMAPGKVSLIPLIRMKMLDRGRRRELASTLMDESVWLAVWVAEKAEHWDTPKASTIKRSLGPTYAALKARSNGGI